MFVLRDVARSFALSSRRAFHLTPSRRSVGKKEALDKILRDSPSFSQLTNDPVAVTAITDLAKVLQQQGIDLTSGKSPSPTQMIRLMMRQDFREATKRVEAELQKIGLDFKSSAVQQEMMNLVKIQSRGTRDS